MASLFGLNGLMYMYHVMFDKDPSNTSTIECGTKYMSTQTEGREKTALYFITAYTTTNVPLACSHMQ